MLRRIRGALVIAALWAVTWGLVGIAIGLVKWYRGDLFDVFPVPATFALRLILERSEWFVVVGAINGLLFALVLALAERRQSVATLSLARFALWGGVATLVLPSIAVLVLLIIYGPSSTGVSLEPLAEVVGLGMACSAVILLIARRNKPGVGEPAA